VKKIKYRLAPVGGVLLGAALFLTVNSYAQESRNIQVSVDGGDPVEVPLEVTQDGKVINWSFIGQLEIGGADGAILTGLNVTADPDPFLGYAIGVVDIGLPSVFGFSIATPIVPTGPPTDVSVGFSASLTDGGDGAISITPVAPGVPVDGDGVPEIHVANDANLPGGLINDGHDLGPGAAFAGAPGDAFVHGPFNESSTIGGPWNWMQLNVTFAGSGGNDLYGLTGSVLKLQGQVPEAGSTLLLTMLGLAGCAISRRMRLFTK